MSTQNVLQIHWNLRADDICRPALISAREAIRLTFTVHGYKPWELSCQEWGTTLSHPTIPTSFKGFPADWIFQFDLYICWHCLPHIGARPPVCISCTYSALGPEYVGWRESVRRAVRSRSVYSNYQKLNAGWRAEGEEGEVGVGGWEERGGWEWRCIVSLLPEWLGRVAFVSKGCEGKV